MCTAVRLRDKEEEASLSLGRRRSLSSARAFGEFGWILWGTGQWTGLHRLITYNDSHTLAWGARGPGFRSWMSPYFVKDITKSALLFSVFIFAPFCWIAISFGLHVCLIWVLLLGFPNMLGPHGELCSPFPRSKREWKTPLLHVNAQNCGVGLRGRTKG